MNKIPTKDIDTYSAGGSDNDEPDILLLVQNPRDRRLFIDFIPDSLTIESHPDRIKDQNFDFCILDEPSLEAHKEALQAVKVSIAPVFLPILLLSQNLEKIQNHPELLEFVDDVVYVPVSQKLLQSRINILFKQREYSLKLEEKNRQLAQKNKELDEERKKYQLLAQNATDMITRHDPDGTYLYVSAASKEILGFTPEELVGKNAFDIIHPKDRKQLLKKISEFQSSEIERSSFRKKTRSGTYKWVETTMRPIIDDTGEITEIQASTRDISDRKEYERKLKEEKEFINKSIESLPELFYLIDEDRNFIKWSNIEEELGYTDGEIEVMNPLDFYREGDREIIKSKITRAFKTGSAEAEVDMISKSGEPIPFYITAKKFSRGDENYLVGFCMNMSQIKKAQFEVEQHRQLLDAIINQTKSLIYLKDKDRKYRLVNDSYLEFYDLDRDDIIGKTDREVHGEAFAQEVGESDHKVIEQHTTTEIEEVRSNGDVSRLYHTIKYPLRGVPGLENCMCGISTDITDLKEASKKLQERIKEQSCLYNISSLSEQEDSIDELLEKALHYLPDGWQYSDITEAAIAFDGKTYKTSNYRDTEWKLSAKSNSIENNLLKMEVVYTEEKEELDEGPFVKEERQLINSIADTLSSQIDRILAQEKLQESRKRWENLVRNAPDLIQILEPDATIRFINRAGAEILGYDNPDELVGKNYLDLVQLEEDKNELTEKRVQEVLKGGEIEPHTFKIRDAKGNLIYLQSQAVPIKLADGRTGLQQVAQDVTDREEYECELIESLKEKETLLQEVHHRVKNNLAVVSGMMELQTLNTTNQEVKNLLNDSKNRIKTMALIHEKLYQSKSLSQIDFGSYVEGLVENIKSVSGDKEIDFELEYNSFSLNVNQAVPCALILNEIISNSYEHAFTDQKEGCISVSLKEKGNDIFVSVSDNGKGFSSEIDDINSMGFTIIRTLIKQLDADLSIDNRDGVKISFVFEKQEIKGSSSALV